MLLWICIPVIMIKNATGQDSLHFMDWCLLSLSQSLRNEPFLQAATFTASPGMADGLGSSSQLVAVSWQSWQQRALKHKTPDPASSSAWAEQLPGEWTSPSARCCYTNIPAPGDGEALQVPPHHAPYQLESRRVRRSHTARSPSNPQEP